MREILAGMVVALGLIIAGVLITWLGGRDDEDAAADPAGRSTSTSRSGSSGTGIDPNTGNPYLPSEASVQVPVALIGASWKINDYVAAGFSVSDSFVGGGDYTAAEPDAQLPYVGHQRYAGVSTAIIQLHMVPAVAVTPIEGLHFGGGLKVMLSTTIVVSMPLIAVGILMCLSLVNMLKEDRAARLPEPSPPEPREGQGRAARPPQ